MAAPSEDQVQFPVPTPTLTTPVPSVPSDILFLPAKASTHYRPHTLRHAYMHIEKTFTGKMINYWKPSSVSGENLILPLVSSISALLRNLQESSQWELALRFVVASFGTCLQHSVSNVMSMSLSEKVRLLQYIIQLSGDCQVHLLLTKASASSCQVPGSFVGQL